MAHDNLQTIHHKAVLSPMRTGLGKGLMPRRAAVSKVCLRSYAPMTEFWNLFRCESDWSSGDSRRCRQTPPRKTIRSYIPKTSTGLCCTEGSSLSDVQSTRLVVCQPL